MNEKNCSKISKRRSKKYFFSKKESICAPNTTDTSIATMYYGSVPGQHHPSFLPTTALFQQNFMRVPSQAVFPQMVADFLVGHFFVLRLQVRHGCFVHRQHIHKVLVVLADAQTVVSPNIAGRRLQIPWQRP